MKKIFITLFMFVISFVSVYAGDLKVVDGKASYIKTGGTATVVFNWSEAQWDFKEPFKQHCGDEYQKYVSDGEKAFLEGFNSAKKPLQITTTDQSNVQYVISIDLTNFDEFFSAMSVVPGHKHKVWATVTVKDASGNMMCKYSVTEFKGGRDFSIFDSFTEMMRDFGKALANQK